MPSTPDHDATDPDSDHHGSDHHGSDHHEGILDRLDDFKHRVEEAAIEAEFETGEREETVEEAKAHALVRVGRMSLGFLVVIVGIAALPLPGPGWLIIAGGLTILSKDVAWAERLLRYIRKRVPGIPEDGKIPRSSMATMAVVTLAAISASLWWTFSRGSDEIQAGESYVVEITEPVSVLEPGIDFFLSDAGSFSVHERSCEPVTIEVIDRSKSEFVLGELEDPDWICAGSRLVERLPGAKLELAYSTDGIVNWFLADDQLSSIEVTDDAGTFRAEVAPLNG